MFKGLFVSSIMLTVIVFALGCGKAKDDEQVAVTAPDIQAAITTNFPQMTIASTSLDLDDGCDSYDTRHESFACSQDFGGSFQRTFSFDPASIYFSSFLIGVVTELINANDESITFGGAESLTLPFLKNAGQAITIEATKTFKLAVADKIETRTDPDHANQKLYIKIDGLKGGFTDKVIAYELSVGIYDTVAATGNPSLHAKFIVYADVTDGLRVQTTSVEYEAQDKDAPASGTRDFASDTTPEGYHKSAKQLFLTSDADKNLKYHFGSISRGTNYFSLIMAGKINKLLLRKRTLGDANPVSLGEQFWAVSFNETSKAFTDLGINDSTDAYKSISGTANFDFTATETVGFGNSLATVLAASFPTLTFSTDVVDYVKGVNMINPLAASDLPTNMSTIATGWTF